MAVSTGELLLIPEIVGLDARRQLVRIPPELDVPMTDRVRKIVDSAPFQRLANVSQLGLVALVYPGARHTRFEHSLGVYRLALLFLKRLAHDERFAAEVTRSEAQLLIAAALLHDIGHWPYCHLIEDLALPEIEPHETLARRFVTRGEIADILRSDWGVDPMEVAALLDHEPIRRKEGESDSEFCRRQKAFGLLSTILSGPIDIDKMDYLFRDSHASGVPYGRHFDSERLIGSLCLNASGDSLAITVKGKTAAELMVFARYVMFSEVYWHHTVRAATAMFQRLFELAHEAAGESLADAALTLSAERWLDRVRAHLAENHSKEAVGATALFDGLFGAKRSIYKRVRQLSILEEPELYRRLAGQKRAVLRRFCADLIERLNAEKSIVEKIGRAIGPNELLVDSPPADREIEFAIDIYDPREEKYRPLCDVSPVVRALAKEQFDDYVKRVRFYAPEKIADVLRSSDRFTALIGSSCPR